MIRRLSRAWGRMAVPRSLRFQLLSRSLFILAFLLILIGAFQYVFMQQFLYRNQASTLQNQILSLPRDLWQPDEDLMRHRDGDRPLFFDPDSTLALIGLDGSYTVLAEPGNLRAPKLPDADYADALQKPPKLNYRVVRDSNGTEQLVVLQTVAVHGRPAGIMQASIGTKRVHSVLLQQLLTFLTLALAALFFGLLTFLPVLKRTLVPLSQMVRTVEQIDAGKLDVRLPDRRGQLETDRLAASFNGMLERLEASFLAEKEAKEQMRRFIADASHELRTPLTSIHGFLEVLLRGAMNHPEQLHKALKQMHSESERIIKLVQDLLLLARLDRSPSIDPGVGPLDAVLRGMEAQLRLLAGEREVRFRIPGEFLCRFDRDKIKQVILNLFSNAVQHTDPQYGRIEVSLSHAGEGTELAVQDNGPGIPEEHLPHIFERFYRIDTSRARKHGGAGLGLAITYSIVELHGGSINVESDAGKGTVFRVWLPK